MNSNNPSRSKKSRKPAETFANIGSTEWIAASIVGLITFVTFMSGFGTNSSIGMIMKLSWVIRVIAA
jgi:hypothetical protein